MSNAERYLACGDALKVVYAGDLKHVLVVRGANTDHSERLALWLAEELNAGIAAPTKAEVEECAAIICREVHHGGTTGCEVGYRAARAVLALLRKARAC